MMLSGRAALARIFRGLRSGRWRKPNALLADESGATAIEFAIITVPFVGILFAILEMSLFLFANQALDTALGNAARKIMTGQVQNGGIDAAQFKTDICAFMPALIDCSGNLHVDVQSYPSAAPAPNKPIAAGAFNPAGFGFRPGGPSCIVVARAALEYPLYVTLLLNNATTELDNGKRVMMSVVSFRNEPYLASGATIPC